MPRPKDTRISQAQIAKEIGCSQALVSMALNGRHKGISEKTYNQIWEFAVQHGYSPRGMMATADSDSSKLRTVGYVLRSPLKLATKSNFFNQVHQGLYDQLNSQRIKTVFLGSEDDLAEAEPFSFTPDSVKAIAIMGEVKPEFLAKIKSTRRPITYISARASGHCHSVLSNEQESGEQLVNHLYKLGHRHFAWLGGTPHMGRHRDRFDGAALALQQRGLDFEERFIARTSGADRSEGYSAAETLTRSAPRNGLPTAWICYNGLMARGAINYLFQNGFKAGKDISVVAFDMTKVCEEERPTITSAGAAPEDMGREAGRILIEAISGQSKAMTDITLPTHLVARESSGPAPRRSSKAQVKAPRPAP